MTLSSSDLTKRWWDLPAALLLVAGMVTAAVRLSATDWTDDLSLVQTVTLLGVVLGLSAGQSIFSRRVVVLLAFCYGVAIISWQIGLTMQPEIQWSERAISLTGRLGHSFGQLIQRKPVNDPILFVTAMASLYWVLSVHGGYMLTRHAHPWLAMLPMGFGLFMIHIHDPFWPRRTWFLATYIFFALLLLARLTFLHNQASWKRSRTRLPPYLGLDLIRGTLLATIVVIILAWTVPAMASSLPLAERAWDRVSQPWTVARSRMSNAFSALRASVGLVYDYYGELLPLGRGNQLADTMIMSVRPADPVPLDAIRFYWRARVYDTYADGQWKSSVLERDTVTPQDFGLTFPDFQGRGPVAFNFTPWVPLSTLYTVPQPQWSSRPAEVNFALNPDGSADIHAIHSIGRLRPGDTYQIQSSISAANEQALRNASTAYPQWVTERYLQLPPSVTQRTRDLAREITDGLDNPYDQAMAVTRYLRDNISYTNTVPPPPGDQDPVDWLLFDLQQGFCNYYASAEIVLLRSLGIPARLGVGYAQGEFDPESGSFFVRQRDAHAWPEVFFPEIGWVEFEPTVSQPPLQRPIGDEEGRDEIELLDDFPRFELDFDREAMLNDTRGLAEGAGFGLGPFGTARSALTTVFLLALSLTFIVLALFAWRRRRPANAIPIPVLLDSGLRRFGLPSPRILRRWAYFAALSPIKRAYNELNKALSRLGRPATASDTPRERASSLIDLLPTVEGESGELVSQYQLSTYGDQIGDTETAREAAQRIRYLSWAAWLRGLFRRRPEI